MFNSAKRDAVPGRSHAVVVFELRNIHDVVSLGAQALFEAPGRFRSSDGVESADGHRDYRLVDELAANAYRPRLMDADAERMPAGGWIFTDIVLVVPADHIRQDMVETGGEAFASELISLAGLIDAKFSQRAWHRGRKARVAAVVSDDLHDSVLMMFGMNVRVPNSGDSPRGRLRFGARENISEPMFLVAIPGQRGPSLVKMPAGVYPGQGRITVASSIWSSPFVAKVPGWEGKVIVDLDRNLALDAQGMSVPCEEFAEGRRWTFPDSDLVVEVTGAVEPKAIPVQSVAVTEPQRQSVGLWARLRPGASARQERHEPKLGGKAAPPSDEPRTPRLSVIHEEPTVVFGTKRSIPSLRPVPVRDDEMTVVPTMRKARVVAVSAAAPGMFDPDQTIVVGAKRAVPAMAYSLELIGIGLPRVDLLPVEPQIPGWHIGIRDDGSLVGAIGDDDMLLGASAKDEHLYQRLPGASKWRIVSNRNGAFEAALPLGFHLVLSPVSDRYHALMLCPNPEVISIADGKARVFGRHVEGEEAAGKVSFPPLAPGAFDAGSGDTASLDRLISRAHLSITLLHGQLHVEMRGKTPAWKMRPDFTVVERLDPGSKGELVLASNDLLLVGCAVVRFRG